MSDNDAQVFILSNELLRYEILNGLLSATDPEVLQSLLSLIEPTIARKPETRRKQDWSPREA